MSWLGKLNLDSNKKEKDLNKKYSEILKEQI